MGYNDGLDAFILDAEEIEYSLGADVGMAQKFGSGSEEEQNLHRASIQTKIRLHREVFPNHNLVGWYRVGDAVTPADLLIQAQFTKEYAHISSTNNSLLFVLMHTTAVANGERKRQDLPITVYETLANNTNKNAETNDIGNLLEQPNTVFAGLDYELSSGQPERIVIEKVFSEQYSATESCSGSNDLQKIQSLSSSLQSLNSCISTLLEFLRRTKSGKIPPNSKLLRQIHGLLSQLPILSSPEKEITHGYNDALIITFLAAVSKTAKALQEYSEKFHCTHESTTNPAGRSSNRDSRRGF